MKTSPLLAGIANHKTTEQISNTRSYLNVTEVQCPGFSDYDVIGDLITNQDNSVLLWTTDLVIL